MGEGVISTHNPRGQSWMLKPPWWPVHSYFWALKGSSAVSDTYRLLGPLCSVQKESGIISKGPWAKGLNQVVGIWFRNQEWVGEDPISWTECVRGKPAEPSSGYFFKYCQDRLRTYQTTQKMILQYGIVAKAGNPYKTETDRQIQHGSRRDGIANNILPFPELPKCKHLVSSQDFVQESYRFFAMHHNISFKMLWIFRE